MPYQPAVLGMARLNNFRLGYIPAALATVRRTRVTILIAGVLANARVRKAGLTVRDILNDAPNTCTFTIEGTAPTTEQDVRITINSDTPRILFTGTLQTVEESYEGKPTHLAWRCAAIDDLRRANRKRPFGTFANVSATTVAVAVMTFAPGMTATHVEAGLPAITITFDGSETLSACLKRIASLIGGYFYFEDLDLHLFQTAEAGDTPDDINSTPKRFLDQPPIHAESDDSQLRTRVYGKGHGEGTTSDVLAADTIIPIVDAVMFTATGGKAIAGTTPDGAQSQILTYTGTELGGGGSLVGPGVNPSAPLTPTVASGAGVEDGIHQYAYTWVTGAGETLPSTLAYVTLGDDPTISAPITANSVNPGGGLTVGATYKWLVTFVTASGESGRGTASIGLVITSNGTALVGAIPIGPAGTTGRNVYRTLANGSVYYLRYSFGDNTSTALIDGALDSYISGNQTIGGNQVALSGIAVGPTGTTQRKVYRTVAGGSQLKLQQTIANNTATTGVQDATADASLGANVPTSDTSGLTPVAGQVNAGSTSVITASAGPFSTSGGWAINGQQTIRYTGISGNSLTGVPATGPGAIVTTMLYGDAIVPSPVLTGVTGLALGMQKGTPVHLWVQRDDLAAQAALAAIDLAQGRVSDGVVENVLSDERRAEASMSALCDADLAQFAYPLVTVTYAARDMKTKSGKPIIVNLTSPLISKTLTIQEVTITEIDVAPGLAPKYMVTASSVRFSLEDILRRLMADQVAA